MEQEYKPNEKKQLIVSTTYGEYMRIPIKTHIIAAGDSLKEVMDRYVMPLVQPGDYILLSEKIVAISQGRAFDIDDIHPSSAAKLLSRFVYKSPYGIGLGSPWTMELAIRDIGLPKILVAAFCSAVTKPFGKRGVFYNIVGMAGRAIDGPCSCTIPPYNHYAKMAPADPDGVAAELREHTGCMTAVMDANDIGVEILGLSDPEKLTEEMCRAFFRDNPLGQGSQQTPIAIVRKYVA